MRTQNQKEPKGNKRNPKNKINQKNTTETKKNWSGHWPHISLVLKVIIVFETLDVFFCLFHQVFMNSMQKKHHLHPCFPPFPLEIPDVQRDVSHSEGKILSLALSLSLSLSLSGPLTLALSISVFAHKAIAGALYPGL